MGILVSSGLGCAYPLEGEGMVSGEPLASLDAACDGDPSLTARSVIERASNLQPAMLTRELARDATPVTVTFEYKRGDFACVPHTWNTRARVEVVVRMSFVTADGRFKEKLLATITSEGEFDGSLALSELQGSYKSGLSESGGVYFAGRFSNGQVTGRVREERWIAYHSSTYEVGAF